MRRIYGWALLAVVALAGGCLQAIGYEDARPGWLGTCAVDHVRNDKETDVDCGGGICPACGDTKGCLLGSDCTSHVCASGSCTAPVCDDKVKNGDESDTDCGGSCGSACGAGKTCGKDGDCKGGSCVGGTCAPTCIDGEKSGDETGVDCGGPACPMCADGQGCSANADCESGVCRAGLCQEYLEWARGWGDSDLTHFSSATAVAATSAGDVILTGTLQGTVDFGGGMLTSAGSGDLVVAKLDSSGSHVWSRQFGNMYRTAGIGLAIDPSGNIAMGGSFHDILKIGQYTLTGGLGAFGDAFVAKFDSNGKPLWALAGTSGGGTNIVRNVATDSSGSVLAAGSFTASLIFDGNPSMSAGGADAFLVKLAPTGLLSWSKKFGDANFQAGHAVAVDSADRVLFGAVSNSAIDLGGGNLGNAGGTDIYLAKHSSSGDYLWGHRYGDSANQDSIAVAVDKDNNVVLAGSFNGAIDFGGDMLTSVGQHDFFVTKLDPDGGHIWSMRFGDASDDVTIRLAVDESGNVLLAGSLVGAIDFGGGPLVSMGGDISGGDVFVAKLDRQGKHVWSRRFGDSYAQSALGIASAGMGAVFLDGSFAGMLDLGAGANLTSTGGTSMFLAKLLTP